jgi:hypothetical protein
MISTDRVRDEQLGFSAAAPTILIEWRGMPCRHGGSSLAGLPPTLLSDVVAVLVCVMVDCVCGNENGGMQACERGLEGSSSLSHLDCVLCTLLAQSLSA